MAINDINVTDGGDLVDTKGKNSPKPLEAPDLKQPNQPSVAAIKKKDYNFQLVGRFVRTSSTRPPFPPSWEIPTEDIVFDEETGTERHIRYLPGIATIFVDEQDVTNEMLSRLRTSIVFTDGHLRVSYTNPTLIKYLMSTNYFNMCKNRMPGKMAQFKLLDYEAMEEQDAAKTLLKMEAMKIALDSPEEKMIPHAKYLGVSFLAADGSSRSMDSIRNQYIKKAESNPEFFKRTYGNPLVNAKYLIDTAIEKGIVVTHIVKGQAHWGKTKAPIVAIPAGKKTSDFLAEFCLTKKGEDFYSQLKDMLSF